MISLSLMEEVRNLVANGADPERAAAAVVVMAAAASALAAEGKRRREAGEAPEEVQALLDEQRKALIDWCERSIADVDALTVEREEVDRCLS
jgi:intracellular sulfur oxidation DsrE/DsrF family protein